MSADAAAAAAARGAADMNGQVPLRVLILCTGNSARSQIAEALFNTHGGGRFVADSAGSRPAARVNPYAVRALAEAGIAWAGHQPQSLDTVTGRPWDLVITVCDIAKEACPIFPGARTLHWGLPDPADVEGDDATKLAAFRQTLQALQRRIEEFRP